MKVILTLMLAAITLSLAAQNTEEVVAEDDMFAPFRTIYRNIESVDFHASADRQTGSILKHHVARKHDMMNGKYYGGQLVHIGKIYRDNVNATRNSGGVTVSSDNSTVRTSTGRQGLTVSERNVASRRAQVDRQAAFAAARQEAIREARRVAARREYERKLREQAIDNQRAAQVEAQANARLQSITNARIARDYQNATVGTVKARETSKATANSLMQGPRPISASQPPRRTVAMT
ncbi:MAG: hypothetical protein K2I52_08520, partial [Muribaculaceae bacterium]|nr:hypothetical protein [Muribaculaceae bacterium]